MALDDTTPATQKGGVDPHAATSAGGGTPQPSTDDATPNLPPERYVHLGHLGSGGMGVVYRVRDLSLGREVALKKLHAVGFSDTERLRRFERETRAAATLDHPHIVRVIDVGVLPDGCPFYTMDLLQGMDIASAARAEKLSVPQAVEAIRQVAEASHYAHQQGILHRDIKPQNVYLKRWPPPRPTTKVLQRFADAAVKHVHAVLLDFGLAKFVDRGLSSESDSRAKMTALQTMTQSGQLIGTPSYMSPEQADASRDLDARADVYGLGATLYHAVTGRPPFVAGSLLELIDMLGTKEPASPRAINPEVNRDLEILILRCLQKRPEDRYQTAEELAEDCQRWLGGESITARAVGPMERVWRRMRRAPLATGVIVVLLGLAGYEGHRAQGSAGEAEVSARRSRIALTTALRDVFEAMQVLRRVGDQQAGPASAARGRAFAEEIEDLAQQLVAADDTLPDPWYYRGRLQRMGGRYDEAEASLGRTIERARGVEMSASSRQLLPLALYERGVLRAVRCLEALRGAGTAGPAVPIDASLHAEAARLRPLALEDLAASNASDVEAGGSSARQAMLGVSWGMLAFLEGKPEGPAYLQRALAQDASSEDAYELLGLLSEVSGSWEEAAGWYEKGRAAIRGASGLLRRRAGALVRRAEELEAQGKDAAEVRSAAKAALEEAEAIERPPAE